MRSVAPSQSASQRLDENFTLKAACPIRSVTRSNAREVFDYQPRHFGKPNPWKVSSRWRNALQWGKQKSTHGLDARSVVRKPIWLMAALLTSGCGTYTPNIQEFPLSATDGVNLVTSIAQSIECEMRRATVEVIDTDKRNAALNKGIRSAPWIDDWGVQVGLTLKMIEDSGVTPSLSAQFPSLAAASPSLRLGAGLPLSAQATRSGTLNYYYVLSDLYQLGECSSATIAKLQGGSRFVRSDLKISEWLQAQALAVGTGTIPLSEDASALTQNITFVATYGANVDATWPGVSSTVGSIRLSAGAGRSQSHSLTMTFGPADPSKKGLSRGAAEAFLAAQIGSEVRNGL